MNLTNQISSALLFAIVGAVAIAQDRGIGAEVGTGSASSEQRVALVIGNSKYENAPLANPVNDATDMAAILKKCGFAVTLKTDCDLRDMRVALDEFGKSISKGGVALFFYAGHGIQVEGENYLIPIGVEPQGPSEVEFDCLPVGRIAAKLEDGQAQLSILILDACRNNPLSRSWSRSAPTGLATMQTPPGSILIYATSPGAVAQDGEGRNGVFTGSLLKNISQPGVKVIDAFQQAAAEVQTHTSGKQVPYLGLTFTGNFTFIQADTVNVTETGKAAMTLPPPPSPLKLVGGLQISMNAPKAVVKIDGKDAGTAGADSAFEKELPVGEVSVEVIAEGYEPLNKRVRIAKGEWTQEAFELSKVMVVKPDEPKRRPTVKTGGEPKAGDVRVFEGGEFAWIPADTFEMGNKLSAARIAQTYGGEEKWYQDAPRHTVTLTSGFWLGTHEVTNGEFEAFVKATGHKTYAEAAGTGRTYNLTSGKFEDTSGASWRKPGWTVDAKLPVVLVSWNDAQAYVRWLSGKGDGAYRLPTEAEWEYACRAGTTTEYFWGDSTKGGQGYLNATDETKFPDGSQWSVRFPFSDSYLQVSPVGSFKANPWGLFDMHGNVNEWCADWYGDYPSGAVRDPEGPTSGQYRVLRGGSLRPPPGYCRAALRYHDTPVDRNTNLGFRLLRTQD